MSVLRNKKEVSILEEIGFLSFARFHDLTFDEAMIMINNPNEVFYSMIDDMMTSFRKYENFMVKIKRVEETGEKLSRLDFLDFD